VVDNDANAAAFGEFWAGAGADYDSMVMFTLGSGVGSGIIVRDHLVRGAHWAGGEMGHIIVVPNGRPCGCGQRGCLEQYASANAAAARALEALRQDPAQGGSGMLARRLKEAGTITSKDLFEAAAAGDPLAERLVDETALYIAIGCINAYHTTDPEAIVLAGGMTRAGRPLLEAVRRHVDAQLWDIEVGRPEVLFPQLGDDAGMIGAAGIACQAHQEGRLAT
jgi:glucokinase